MPADLPPSEFGGKVQKNGIQPQSPNARSPRGFPPAGGHEPTASEKLRLVYMTGQDEDSTMDRVPGAFKDGHIVTEE